jgi:hypothetical protein
MGFCLFNHKLVARINQELVRLFVRQTEIDKMGHKTRKFVEYQVLVVLDFLAAFFFFSFEHSFNQLSRKKFVDSTFLGIVHLFFSFLSTDSVFNFGQNLVFNAITPVGHVGPNPVV